jgi:hypothetical protein
MNEGAKSFFAAGGILACAAAALGGLVARDRIETGEPVGGAVLYASRDANGLTNRQEFDRLVQLLQNEFVDPLPSQAEMADGAVKGMVEGLGEPGSRFLDAAALARRQALLAGTLEGIGAELTLHVDHRALDKARAGDEGVDSLDLLPELRIAAIAPGSGAERAGMKPGDRIDSAAGRWVVSPGPIRELRRAQEAEQKDADDLARRSRELQAMARDGLSAEDARDRLTVGAEGRIRVAWFSGGLRREAEIERGRSRIPLVQKAEGAIRLRLGTGAALALREALPAQGPITLDLRAGGEGDFSEVGAVYAVLAPGGAIGHVAGRRSISIAVQDGARQARPITLIVDSTVTGAAQALAIALSAHAGARLKGAAMVGEPRWIELKTLPTGSAYTLDRGPFRAALSEAGQ